MTKKKFTSIDLFAGIGGFHTAMRSVGGKCVFANEWDKNARLSYEANYIESEPHLFKKGGNGQYLYFNEDINHAIPSEMPNFDICCRGARCQTVDEQSCGKNVASPKTVGEKPADGGAQSHTQKANGA